MRFVNIEMIEQFICETDDGRLFERLAADDWNEMIGLKDNAYREARVPVLKEGYMMELEMYFCNQVAALEIGKRWPKG